MDMKVLLLRTTDNRRKSGGTLIQPI